MNKVIAGLFAAALFGTSFAMADTGSTAPASKDLKKVVEEGPYVETAQKGIKLSGYVDAGYSYNFAGNNGTLNRFPGDQVSRGDFNLNAVKVALEKPLTDANELQAGFRVDALMGEDAGYFTGHNGTTTAGSSSSDSIFLEQAYVQFRLPYGNGIDFKVGKMATLLGYEVVERPTNMNITYGNIFQNFLPVWNTGVVAAYKFNDNIDAKFGVVNPTNSDNGVGATTVDARKGDNAALVAALNLKNNGGNANFYQAVQYTINGDSTLGSASENRPSVVYDAYVSWMPKFAKDKLLLALNGNIGNGPRNALATSTFDQESATWYGVALYSKYQFTDIFSLANRVDYTHTDKNGIYQTGVLSGTVTDIWSETITAGFDVIENVTLRAEYRLDWGNNSAAANGDGPSHYAGAEIVYSF